MTKQSKPRVHCMGISEEIQRYSTMSQHERKTVILSAQLVKMQMLQSNSVTLLEVGPSGPKNGGL